MISEELLDGPLAAIRFHNIERNQDFNTDWISDLSEKQIQDIVVTLHAYGYITYKPVSKNYHTAYLCKLTPEGMKFCKEGGFKAHAKSKQQNRIKAIGWLIALIASLATIAAFIWQLLSR